MKTTIWIALILGLLAVSVAAGGASSPKPVDTYADHKDFCYKKCTHYKTLKGKCVDYEWVGTKKECCEWKTVGKGKCAEYKKSSKCCKYSKAKRVCLGHGYRQVCNKITKEKLCAKYEWKQLCKGHGKNHKCDKYAYHFICTKYDHSERCAAETYIPKIKYFYKKRCARYVVDQYCAKYKKICKTVAKWVPITKKHYLGWFDTYYHQVLEKKFRTICVAYAKKKTCAKFEHVKFAKKVGYIKKCVKFIKNKFCVAKKKVRFCTKFCPTKFCNLKEKVRICKAFKKQHFCCSYKAIPFCTQFKNLKPKCIKRKFKKECCRRSPGVKICAKFNFVGGKKICRKYGKKSVCDKYKTVCNKVDTYNPPTPKVDTYAPKKPDTYQKK